MSPAAAPVVPLPPGVKLVLASQSPQRFRILTDAGYAFQTCSPGEAEEEVAHTSGPADLAAGKARAKAAAVAAQLHGARTPDRIVVLGVDTLCDLDGAVLEKPLDRLDAVRILKRLSGTRHRCISGLCLWPLDPASSGGTAPEPEVLTDVTWVQMRVLSDAAVQAYVDSGESDGKAGAYAIQGTADAFVERLDGSFLNVVGFPLEAFHTRLPAALKRWGWMK